MLCRIEFTKNKSSNWHWVLRMIRKHPTYKMVRDSTLEVHSLDLTEYEYPFICHLEDLTQTWKTVNWILDGEFDTRYRVIEIMYEAFSKVSSVDATIWRSQRDARLRRQAIEGDTSRLLDAPTDTASCL